MLEASETTDIMIDNELISNDELMTHTKIKSHLVGRLISLKQGYAKVILEPTHEMVVDDFGLIHSGFVFGSAEYAAVACINQENVVIIAATSQFFAPAKLGNTIEFEAKGDFQETRKRHVHVVGKINTIKIFEATFQAVILDNHIFKTKLDELHNSLDN